tara:strand:- start:432 stop:1406 length:975 start_codon:yes stop_codon:yes gene_type:complete
MNPNIYRAIIAGAAISYSTKVKADPFKIIAEAIAQVVKIAYNEISEMSYESLLEQVTSNKDDTSGVQAISTDNRNETQRAIYEAEIARRSFPQPDACNERDQRIKTGAFNNAIGEAAEGVATAQTTASLTSEYTNMPFSNIGKIMGSRYGVTWPLITSSYAALPAKKRLKRADHIQLAADYITTVNGSAGKGYPSLLKELTKALPHRTIVSQGALLEIDKSAANLPLNSMLSRRLVADKNSALEELESEIKRTYGDRDGKYRTFLNKMPSEVPAMKEALKVKSFNNYLKHLIYLEKEKLLLLKTIKLANQMRHTQTQYSDGGYI